MTLKEVNKTEVLLSPRSKQSLIRDILDSFLNSNMECAEIEHWEDVSDTLESFRQIVKNQLSYRNGNRYKDILIKISTVNGYKAYLLRKEK